MIAAALAALLGLAQIPYEGKYESDARLQAIRAKLPLLRDKALVEIGEVLGEKPPEQFSIRLEDSNNDRTGAHARVRTEGGRPVVVLSTEHLVLKTHDLERTLVHELYHCLQRRRLGEKHDRQPAWAREGAALFVAGQLEERTRALAAFVGADPRHDDPLSRLVDGLGGRHTLEDYAEDVCAFDAVERRHGRGKAVALLARLLETDDARAAIRRVLGEDFETFQRATAEHARRILGPLVRKGREEILVAKRRIARNDFEGALFALSPVGVYAAEMGFLRALALHRLGRHDAAEGVLSTVPVHEAGAWLLLELRLLKERNKSGYEAAAARARLDLQPFTVYPELVSFLDG